MNYFYLEFIFIGLFLAVLFFLSTIESALNQSNRLTLRMMLEREESPRLLPRVLEDESQLIVPLHLGTQTSMITIAILTTHLSLIQWPTWGVAYSFGIVFIISMVCRQLLPRLVTQYEPEKKLVRLLQNFDPVLGVLCSLALPLSGVLRLFRKLHEDVETGSKPENNEATGEEIQAYLEIGEDQGILQEEDTALIQSVVEFGDTLVRDVMTPRTKIVGCEEKSTIGELRDVMIEHRHSRIPIFRENVDNIVGIAYIRQLVAEYAKGRESDPITGLINPAFYVPETKPVSKLLRELQERGDHTAIVIDEFGGVAGLVTIEDLVEEIVGEIRDEDQAKMSEVVEDGPRAYILRGSTELSRLEDLIGRKFEDPSATVAGLVVTFLGRVPAPGEEFRLHGLQVRILDSDRKRVRKLRIQVLDPESDACRSQNHLA
jgi:putative hemolysin